MELLKFLFSIRFDQILIFFTGKIGFMRLASIFIPLVLYFASVDFYDEDLNVAKYIRVFPHNYAFYSGTQGGMYSEIGVQLDSADKHRPFYKKPFNISVQNEATNGGYQNPLKVLTNPNSFGLVEDEIYPQNDFVRQQLNYIAPIYLERMHFIYNREAFRDKPLFISSHTDPALLELLATNRISTGPIGGGSKILGSYMMNLLNHQIKKINETRPKLGEKALPLIGNHLSSIPINSAYQQLAHGNLDGMMLIAGCSLSEVQSLLTEKTESGSYRFALACIDPSFISELNEKYHLSLRLTDFIDKSKTSFYPRENDSLMSNLSTLGTYCYLITNKETPPCDIKLMIEKLKNIQDDTTKKSALSEMRFLDSIKTTSQNSDRSAKNLILFVLYIAIGMFIMSGLGIWLTSKVKHDGYVERIFNVTLHIPDNKLQLSEIEKYKNYSDQDEIYEFLEPSINPNQIRIISTKVVPAIHEITDLRNDISEDFSQRKLTDEHYTFLMNRCDVILAKFKKVLGLRLNEVIESKHERKYLSIDLLKKYRTAEYISMDDYERLVEKLKTKSIF